MLIKTSFKSRNYAQKILRNLVYKSDINYYKILNLLKHHLNESLKNEEISEQFFELLQELLLKSRIEEMVKKIKRTKIFISESCQNYLTKSDSSAKP